MRFLLKKNNYSIRRGFTLLELLVVIAIIGILASVIIVSVSSSKNKASVASVVSNFNTVISDIENQYNISGYLYGSGQNFASSYRALPYSSAVNPGPADCPAMFTGSVGSFTTTKTYLAIAEAMRNTDIPSGASSKVVWCVTNSTGTNWALAIQGLRTGPNSYCVDSAGKKKFSSNTYSYATPTMIDTVNAVCL